jgi:NADPH:quinone reductase-like Zn-dependent oxidoreductase
VGNRAFADLRRALTPEGVIIPNSGHGGMSYVFKAFLLSPFMRQQGKPLMTINNQKDLLVLKELIESGQVRPVIDQTYSLSEAPEALGYASKGHVAGKVVITVQPNGQT